MTPWREKGLVALAAVMLLASATKLRPRPPGDDARTGTTAWDDHVRPVPAEWSRAPIVGKLDREHQGASTSSDFLISATHTAQAPLGDVFARYSWDVCTAGGSACANTPPSLHDVLVGDLDEVGQPIVATAIRCAGTSLFLPVPTKSSCDPASMSLRLADDGTYIVTFRDPDSEEHPFAAFTRTRIEHTGPRIPRAAAGERYLLFGFAVALFGVGVAALGWGARRARLVADGFLVATFLFGVAFLLAYA